MKLWHSFVKELLLSTRSFYFWVELLVAVIMVAVLVLLVPEQSEFRQDEYIYLDMNPAARLVYLGAVLTEDQDGQTETVEYELDGETITTTLYQTDDSNIYVVGSEEDAIALADRERDFAGIVRMDNAGETSYTYYMQGYETERLRNIYRVVHLEDAETVEATFNAQDVRTLEEAPRDLNDRQFVLPAILTLNGSMMGIFIIASYVFLDKKEGVIKAYAVTASAVWQYLLSKAGVLILVSTLTSLFITVAIMGGAANYLLMLVLLVSTAFFAAALGLVLTSFYKDIAQAFGVLYLLIIVLALPALAYFIPSWSPIWIQVLPTYPMIMGFRETLLAAPDVTFVLTTSAIFLLVGIGLFIFANIRFKQSLTV